MSANNFTTSFTVDQSPEDVFAAINDVRGWWTGVPGVDGPTCTLGDEFVYRFEPHHESRQKIVELVPGKRIAWHVVEASINFVKNRSEWTGTTIVFDIVRTGEKTEVRFSHEGLNPAIECFDSCSNAWSGYINGRLRDLIRSTSATAKTAGRHAV